MLVHLVSLLLCIDFLRVLCEHTPVIIFITPDQHKFIGETVEFSCAPAYNNPEYAIFWMKEDFILSSNSLIISKDERLKIKHNSHNNTYTLVLENIQESDSGEFKCQILHNQKSISNSTKLTVLVEEIPSSFKPEFISKPVNITVKTGANVILPCDVDQLGDDYVLLWKKESAVLTASRLRISHNSRLELLPNWHLKITNILPEDAGTYICQISTEEPMELKHLVLLEAAPTTSITIDTHENVNEVVKTIGEELKVHCVVTGNPPPKIMWKKMNGHLPGGNFTFSGPVLRVFSLHKEDSGIYFCTASNGVGSESSASFMLHIQFPPIVHTAKKQVITGVGLTVKLHCEFEVFPSANLTWYINEKKIENQLRYVMSDDLSESGKKQISTLNIKSVTHEDFANYTCSGANRFGNAKAVIEVTGMPDTVEIKRGKTSTRPSNYHIDWVVESYSPILRYKLRLRKVDKMSKEEEWIEKYITAENREGPKQQQTYDISDLDPETTYQIVMNAENQYGWNPDSNVLEFKTGPLRVSPGVPEFQPSPELDVGEVKPEQSQQPGNVENNKSPSQQSNIVYLLTIGMLVAFFWL